MNYLFRPTPVAVLGRDRGADTVQLVKSPAGTMMGSPGKSNHPSRSLSPSGVPWIVRSGTMASFGTLGQALGQDDGSDGFDFSTAYNSPTLPDMTDGTAGSGFDYSTAYASPNLPGVSMIPPAVPTGPDFGSLPLVNSSIPPPLPVSVSQPAPPPGGAGPTGQSIPGTKPLNTAPVVAPSVVPQATNLFSQILSAVTGPAKPAAAVKLPAAGVNPNIPAPSFWTGSTIFPGVPNTTVIFGGLAAIVLLMAVSSGGKK